MLDLPERRLAVPRLSVYSFRLPGAGAEAAMRGGQNLFQVLVAIREAHLERSPGIMLAQGKNALASGRTGSDLGAEAGPPGVNMEKQGRWAAEAEALVLKPCFRKFRIQHSFLAHRISLSSVSHGRTQAN